MQKQFFKFLCPQKIYLKKFKIIEQLVIPKSFSSMVSLNSRKDIFNVYCTILQEEYKK